jgi:YD repeat-containing protein
MTSADDDSGLVRLRSRHAVPDSLDRLAGLLEGRGILIFARIDFSGDAARAGLSMRPEQMLIFGNPNAGTALMQAAPLAGIDLPLKVLAYEDADGQTWLAYNAPEYVVRRHRLAAGLAAPLAAAIPLIEAAAQ